MPKNPLRTRPHLDEAFQASAELLQRPRTPCRCCFSDHIHQASSGSIFLNALMTISSARFISFSSRRTSEDLPMRLYLSIRPPYAACMHSSAWERSFLLSTSTVPAPPRCEDDQANAVTPRSDHSGSRSSTPADRYRVEPDPRPQDGAPSSHCSYRCQYNLGAAQTHRG